MQREVLAEDSLAYINFVALQLQYTLTFLRRAKNCPVADLPL